MATYRVAVKPGWAFLVPGDLHFPRHDEEAVRAMCEWWSNRNTAKLWDKTGVILQGDTLDCYGLSRFGKSAKRYWSDGRLKTGVDSVAWFLAWAGAHQLGCLYIMGNHDAWTARFVDELPALEGLPGVKFAALTGIDKIAGVEVLNEDTRVLLGDKVVVAHGHKLRGKTITSIVRNYPDQVTVYGHYHRIESQLATVYGPDGEAGIRGAYCVGMMCSDEAVEEYAPDPNMQRGFAVVEFFGDRGGAERQPFFSVQQKLVVKDKAGRAYVA